MIVIQRRHYLKFRNRLAELESEVLFSTRSGQLTRVGRSFVNDRLLTSSAAGAHCDVILSGQHLAHVDPSAFVDVYFEERRFQYHSFDWRRYFSL